MKRKNGERTYSHDEMIRAIERAEGWKTEYESEHQRVVDLATEHTPKLLITNADSLPGFGKKRSMGSERKPEFLCASDKCLHFWPCPTYLWATGSEAFTLEAVAKNSSADVEEDLDD